MATVHQSDLTAWIRCPAAFSYERSGQPRRQNSALAYGSVMHYALEVFERLRHSDNVPFPDAVEAAVETFSHYWHPLHIDAICPPVELWLPKQSYGELRTRGMEAIRAYADLVRFDDHELLATELAFTVPIEGTWDEDRGEPHVLAGTIDRLAVRHHRGKPVLCVDDFKSGQEYRYLRQNVQFTAYCYATTRAEFWRGWRGEDGFGPERGQKLYERFARYARRGTWINLRTAKFQDAGWRGQQDYTRFAIAVEQLVASMKAEIYPLSLSGSTCQHCEFGPICAGVGLPDANHGSPTR